jgi:hypothetical protein
MQPYERETTPAEPERYAHVRELARSALARALDGRQNGTPQAKEELRALIRDACDFARHQGLRAEQLLIILKQAWQPLSETRFRDRAAADDAMEQVVTVTIDEYYRLEVRP